MKSNERRSKQVHQFIVFGILVSQLAFIMVIDVKRFYASQPIALKSTAMTML